MKLDEYKYLSKKFGIKAELEVLLILFSCLIFDLIIGCLPINQLSRRFLYLSIVFAFISFSMIVYNIYKIKIKIINEEGIDDNSSGGIYNKKELI